MNQHLDILYVEDDAPSIYLVEEAFAESTIPSRVHAVQSRSEALAFLAGEGEYADAPRPDLILLDLDLGDDSGFDVLVEMRACQDLEALPVVVFTTSDSQTDVATAYDRGANAFVQKPGDYEGLVAFTRGAADFWGSASSPSKATG